MWTKYVQEIGNIVPIPYLELISGRETEKGDKSIPIADLNLVYEFVEFNDEMKCVNLVH